MPGRCLGSPRSAAPVDRRGARADRSPCAGTVRHMHRVLFVTRKFPPSVGGMETLAADVWRALDGADARLVAHGGSNRALPLFLARATWTKIRASRRRDVDV